MSTKRQLEIKAQKEGKELDFKPAKRSAKGPAGHYVKNSELLAEFIKCKEEDKLSDKLVLMFQQIAERLSVKLMYNDPMDREDCIATAVADCIKYWRNFNPEVSSNAFAYVTSIVRNGYAKCWRSMEKMKLPDSMKVSLSDNLYSI